jgi:hypothetical protein
MSVARLSILAEGYRLNSASKRYPNTRRTTSGAQNVFSVQISYGTKKGLANIANPLIFIKILVRPTEFESVTPAFGGQYSIQLSYGR